MKLFIGTGLLGAAFVKAMLERGDNVRVWNRTIAKAETLAEDGAEVCADVKEAVSGIQHIHVCLKDDASVNEVLAKAEKNLERGTVIVDHTTTSVDGAIERTQKWKEKGITYQHAPVLMGPTNALHATGNMLVSGDQQVINRLEPELSKMTGTLLNLGDVVGKAAGMKLVGNQFLMAINGGISDSLELVKSMGFSSKDVQDLYDAWDPGAVAKGSLKKILSDRFQNASWELVMARKDARLMMEEAQKAGNKLTVVPAVAQEMDKWIEKGHGQDDWTVFVSEHLPEK